MLWAELGFLGGSDSKESTCNAGDLGLILRLERSTGKGMATHSSILAWRIPWTGEPEGLYSIVSRRVGHNWSDTCRLILSSNSYCNNPGSVPYLLVKVDLVLRMIARSRTAGRDPASLLHRHEQQRSDSASLCFQSFYNSDSNTWPNAWFSLPQPWQVLLIPSSRSV